MKRLAISLIAFVLMGAFAGLSVAEQKNKPYDSNLNKDFNTQKEYNKHKESYDKEQRKSNEKKEEKKTSEEREEKDNVRRLPLPDPCLKKPDLPQCKEKE